MDGIKDKPLDDKKLSKLNDAVKHMRDRLKPFREKRKEFISEYVGMHYGDQGVAWKRPVNMMELAVTTYARQLAARNPAVLVTTDVPVLKPNAYKLELAMNHLLPEMDLKTTIQHAVVDAFFGVAIAEVGLNYHKDYAVDGFTHDPGEPYCELISLDDFVFDMNATRWNQMSFCGHRYRMPLEWAKTNQMFDEKARKDLKKTSSHEKDTGKASELSGEYKEEDEYKEFVEIWAMWLPCDERRIHVVWEADSEGGKKAIVLSDRVWDGPADGPYHILGFSHVPDNVIPLPQAATMHDLNMALNRVFRKLVNQAERQKTIVAVTGNPEDADAIKKANDGEGVFIKDMEAVKEIKFGGVDGPSALFATQLQQTTSYMEGNIDLLGGLSPQSETAAQDKMLNENANVRVQFMRDKVMDFSEGIIHDLAWYLFTDPLIEVPITMRLEGFEDIWIPSSFTPEDREGDFLSYNFRIAPHSMRHQSPEERFAALSDIWVNHILPAAPLMQMQGMAPNIDEFLRVVSKYKDLPEIKDLIIYTGMPPQEAQPIGNPPSTKPAVTKRTYERINRPGGTQMAKQNNLMQMYAGAGMQPAQTQQLQTANV